MRSFKLHQGGSLKQQTRSAGWLLVILGIVSGLFIDMLVGYAILMLGIGLVIAASAADS